MQVTHSPERWRASLLLALSLAGFACKGGNGSEQGEGEGESGDDGDPVPVEPGEFTYAA